MYIYIYIHCPGKLGTEIFSLHLLLNYSFIPFRLFGCLSEYFPISSFAFLKIGCNGISTQLKRALNGTMFVSSSNLIQHNDWSTCFENVCV